MCAWHAEITTYLPPSHLGEESAPTDEVAETLLHGCLCWNFIFTTKRRTGENWLLSWCLSHTIKAKLRSTLYDGVLGNLETPRSRVRSMKCFRDALGRSLSTCKATRGLRGAPLTHSEGSQAQWVHFIVVLGHQHTGGRRESATGLYHQHSTGHETYCCCHPRLQTCISRK